MERTINGPDHDYLTDVEAAAYLRIDPEDFRQFVKLGLVPKGIPYGKRVSGHRWPWLDVVAVGHLMSRGFIKLPGEENTNPP